VYEIFSKTVSGEKQRIQFKKKQKQQQNPNKKATKTEQWSARFKFGRI
jgi:hypothetical protein